MEWSVLSIEITSSYLQVCLCWLTWILGKAGCLLAPAKTVEMESFTCLTIELKIFDLPPV